VTLKNWICLFCALEIFSGFASFAAPQEVTTRIERTHAVGVELVGRAHFVSVFFDTFVDDNWALGIGFGPGSVSQKTAAIGPFVVPIYLNYHMGEGSMSYFGTIGLTNSLWVGGDEPALARIAGKFAIVPHLGVGFEVRRLDGLLLRLLGMVRVQQNTGYPVEIQPWLGISAGLNF